MTTQEPLCTTDPAEIAESALGERWKTSAGVVYSGSPTRSQGVTGVVLAGCPVGKQSDTAVLALSEGSLSQALAN